MSTKFGSATIFSFLHISCKKGLVDRNMVANIYITSVSAGYFTSNGTKPTAMFTFMVRTIEKQKGTLPFLTLVGRLFNLMMFAICYIHIILKGTYSNW